jgi:hypothetical protein
MSEEYFHLGIFSRAMVAHFLTIVRVGIKLRTAGSCLARNVEKDD